LYAGSCRKESGGNPAAFAVFKMLTAESTLQSPRGKAAIVRTGKEKPQGLV